MSKKTMAVLRVDGTREVKVNYEPTLEEAQELVGGYVEVIRRFKGVKLLVNDEGRLHNLPYNYQAHVAGYPELVGTVVVLSGARNW